MMIRIENDFFLAELKPEGAEITGPDTRNTPPGVPSAVRCGLRPPRRAC